MVALHPTPTSLKKEKTFIKVFLEVGVGGISYFSMLNKKQLMEIGLTDKEAGVYLALLELGPAMVAHIARKANINRTTGYDILEMLSGKGLVSIIAKEGIKKYSAEDPQKVIAYSQNKLQQVQQEHEATKKLLPELKSIFHKAERPKVKFYEGKEGLKEAYNDTLTTKNPPLLGYSCIEQLHQSLPNFLAGYLKKRITKKISARMIAPDTPGIRELIKTDKHDLRESRLLPKDKIDLAIEINIYDNKIMIASWEEDLGIIIESEKIAEAQKQIFELDWEAAEKYQQSKGKGLEKK